MAKPSVSAVAGAPVARTSEVRSVATVMRGYAPHHLTRLELELHAHRDPALREKMVEAASVFWRMCAAIAAGLGSPDPVRDGRAMTAMMDGLLLDYLAHPPQDRELVVAAMRRLLTSSA